MQCTMEVDVGSLAVERMEAVDVESLAVGRMEAVVDGDSLKATKSEKNLMDIPKELFDLIFSNLQLNDLLRLRRVSKQMKPLAEDYLRLHVNSKTFFEMDFSDDEDKALSALLAFDFVAPFSKFNIGHVKDDMWRKWRIQEFLEIYGTRVTHLEIESIEIPIISRKAINFFEALPNLEYLMIDKVEERGRSLPGRQGVKLRASNAQKIANMMPSTFKHLRHLLIDEYDCTDSLESAGLICKFVEECSSRLETIQYWDMDIADFTHDLGDLPGGRFGSIRRILEGPNPSHFKSCDLIKYIVKTDDDASLARDFYDLVSVCAKHDVKLENVDGQLIEEMMKLETRDKEDHGKKISSVVVSLRGIHKSFFLLEFPHLEELYIWDWDGDEAGVSELISMPSNFHTKTWPSLKNLSICVDSSYLYGSIMGSNEIWDHVLTGIKGEKMEKLTLMVECIDDLEEVRVNLTLPYPRIIDVCRSCPNLKVLDITYWPETNQAMSKLWGNLPLLEEVWLCRCRHLGDEAFVGDNKESPAFHQAKNLRCLLLSELWDMPKITDTFFTLVLRHMPLRQLLLHSTKTINNKITIAGISSLLTGVFSETIEKLVVHLNLDGVPPEELKALQMEFRSYWRML